MAEALTPGAGHIIEHKPSSNFIREPVEHANVGSMTSSGGETKISIFFSRDELEVTHETLISSPRDPEKLVPVVSEDAISAFRLQVANITMSIKTAKSLLKSLESTIKKIDGEPDE